MMIFSVRRTPFPDAAWLTQAISSAFPGATFPPVQPGSPASLWAAFETSDGPAHVSLLSPESLSVEGSEPAQAEFAAWFRSVLAPDFPRVDAVGEGWTSHVTLTPGITAAQVEAGWIEEDDASWMERDPDYTG